MRWIAAIIVGLIVAALINHFLPGWNGISTQAGSFQMTWKWIVVIVAMILVFWKLS